MSDDFAVGQRWISDTETDLGLGTIVEVEFRQLAIVFLATGDMRRYAKETAPLTRVAFVAGDTISSHEGWRLEIGEVVDTDGLLSYRGTRVDTGEPATLDERDLDNFLRFRTPRDRLFAGLIDGQRWYTLRRDVFEHRDRLARSPIRGLTGPRVSVLPHQMHIAVEALSRPAPRLLLADEVGLGKTIEAGLILHAMLVRRRIERVLIVVPAPLLHQWLLEMYRKFNLRFALFDTERFEAAVDSSPDNNPFLSEQLVLVSGDTLLDDAMGQDIGDAAVAAGFDLLVVDEAHHLAGDSYELVESLARTIDSVLLLTATPEQLGRAGHFDRLRLLDPDRFDDAERFAQEEAGFERIASIAGRLHDDEALDSDDIDALQTLLGTPFDDNERKTLGSTPALAMSDIGERLVGELVDRHGTGRVMFRNTRRAISGFPERVYHPHELDGDGPEALVDWLAMFLAGQPGEKVLVIAADPATVTTLAEALRVAGIDSAQFHEGMSIVERDRAAAWFADTEDGCRLLLCSEIGSEGRNFQFLSTLVTVELPDNPDLLEQRIGRLDRIGQRHEVRIHVPAAPGSRDARLARWYHQGLDAFESLCRTGGTVRAALGDELDAVLSRPAGDAGAQDALDVLLERTRALSDGVAEQLENGRDRLLELNSNRPERVQEHLDAFARAERDLRLQDFMAAIFDRFGVEVSEQSGWWILAPSDNMQMERFPHLPGDGLSVTFEREIALAREDLTFLTWDHPMVTASMDLILDEGFGQADCQVIRSAELTPGLAVIDASYVLECVAAAGLMMERFLPARVMSFQLGIDGRDWTERFATIEVENIRVKYDRNQLRQVTRKNRAPLEQLIARTAKRADAALPALVDEARDAIRSRHAEEHGRLEALARVNPAVETAELDALVTLRDERLAALADSHARPVSVRVLFNN